MALKKERKVKKDKKIKQGILVYLVLLHAASEKQQNGKHLEMDLSIFAN